MGRLLSSQCSLAAASPLPLTVRSSPEYPGRCQDVPQPHHSCWEWGTLHLVALS